MRKLLLPFLVFLFLSSSAQAQFDIIKIADEARACYDNDSIDCAIVYFDSIQRSVAFNISNLLFSIYMSNALEDKKALNMIHQYANSDVASAHIIKPVSFFLRCFNEKDKDSLNRLYRELRDSVSEENIKSHYGALAYTAAYMQCKEKINLRDKEIMLRKLIRINESSKKLRWYSSIGQYIDIILFNELYKEGIAPAAKVLDLKVTPNDLYSISFVPFVNNEEIGLPTIIDIKKALVDTLLRKEKTDQNLQYALDIVVMNPTLEQQEKFRAVFPSDKDFDDFWNKYSRRNWQKFAPPERIQKWIDSLSRPDQWLVIDVWGTWCGACLNEMPELLEMEKHFTNMPGEPAIFLTFSYLSQNLRDFMKEKGYNFPVIEISQFENRQMGITGYPTTYLISPEDKYILLPYKKDKQEIVQVFTLLRWSE